jgi:hypothetical protein
VLPDVPSVLPDVLLDVFPNVLPDLLRSVLPDVLPDVPEFLVVASVSRRRDPS